MHAPKLSGDTGEPSKFLDAAIEVGGADDDVVDHERLGWGLLGPRVSRETQNDGERQAER